MVEIAISIAVVAFAMVAIIGVLPTGFQVQKQNREDTIINQDGALWIEAIRSGARGMDYLTNYLENGVVRIVSQAAGRTNVWMNQPGDLDGAAIVGLLTQLRYTEIDDVIWANSAVAYVQAISGSAINKTPQNNLDLKYRLTTAVAPLNPAQGMNTNLNEFDLAPAEWVGRSNLIQQTVNRGLNLFDIRVTLEWPVYMVNQDQRRVGNNKKVFRTLASGSLLTTNAGLAGREVHFIQPSKFVRAR